MLIAFVKVLTLALYAVFRIVYKLSTEGRHLEI